MWQCTWFITTISCFLIVILALLWCVQELIWRATIIKGLMSIYTMVPIVVFWFISTKSSLVAINVEYDWVNHFEVSLESLLKGVLEMRAILAYLSQLNCHSVNVIFGYFYVFQGIRRLIYKTLYISINLCAVLMIFPALILTSSLSYSRQKCWII